MALNDKYEQELAYVKGIVVQKDQEIERLRKEIEQNRQKKGEMAEENVNDTPVVVKGTITEKRVRKVTQEMQLTPVKSQREFRKSPNTIPSLNKKIEITNNEKIEEQK